MGVPEEKPPAPSFYVGLDLGQAADYSALCVVEELRVPDPAEPKRQVRECGVRHLHRWKLGTPYSAIVADLAALAKRPPLPGATLVVDATGVGRPVVELIERAGLSLRVCPVTITGGLTAGMGNDGSCHVPKKDLVAVMQTLVQFRRFHIAPTLQHAANLGRELQMFRVKVTVAGNETFEAWRERDHDDLVLAVALACWYGKDQGPFETATCIESPPSMYQHIFGASHDRSGATRRRLFGSHG